MRRDLLNGVVAGAVGTTVLNAVTFLDMAVRARPASTTPEQTVRRAEELSGYSLSGAGSRSESAGNRRSGIGALMGIGAGVGAGAVYGVVRPRLANWPLGIMAIGAGLGANVASTAPMTALGVTDPRTWPASSWLMDLVPHLAYGAATVAAFEMLADSENRWKKAIRRCLRT